MPIARLTTYPWLALLAGAVAPLALAPLNWWPLALLSVMGFAYSLRQTNTASRTLLAGFAYGAGYFLVGVSWVYVSMVEHGGTPVVIGFIFTLLFCLGMALFYVACAYIYQRWLQHRGGLLGMLLFASLWVAMDMLRGWLLTGFPWLYIGYAGLPTWLSGYGPLVGQYGITWLLVLTALLLLGCLRNKLYMLVVMAVWVAGLGLQQVSWTQATEVKQITLLQGNVDLAKKWQPQQLQPTLEYYFGATYEHLDSDIIIWPETAVATYWDNVHSAASSLHELATAEGAIVIAGTVSRREPKAGAEYYNALVAFGAEQGIYAKQRLVPFGEYVPLENWLRGAMELFDLPMSRFRIPPFEQEILVNGDAPIAGNICYEIAYAGLVAKQARNAQLLVTVSNDTWFGDTWAPWQHLQMAQMRAIENGRPVARSTNSGVTALIDHQGQIIAMAPMFEQAELTGQLQLRQGQTPYNFLANLFN